MLDRIARKLGLKPAIPASQVDEIAGFCAALTETFKDRLPQRFERSLLATAGWWSIALYVQLSARMRTWRFDEELWNAASLKIADHMMARLFPDFPSDEPEHVDLRDALQGQVLAQCKFWMACFGPRPKPEDFQRPERTQSTLRALFGNEELDLRERFDLFDDDMPEEEAEPGGASEIEELCSAYALFFDICSRSQP
jgi:hypothetical protein